MSTTVRGAEAQASGSGLRLERLLVSAGLIGIAVVLVAAAAVGGAPVALLAVAVAGYVCGIAVLGRERMGIATMALAFATAPMYKGLAASPSTSITPTDILLVLAVFVLFPSVVLRRVSMPPVFVVGLAILFVMVLIGTLQSTGVYFSVKQLVQWMSVMALLPAFFAVWRPSWRVVSLFAWSYVAGQMVSTVDALIEGAAGVNGRYQGLAHHPNAFAEGAMMSFALLLYLFQRQRSLWARLVIVACALAAVESVVLSGSRAALVVVAALLVMVPVVERSAMGGFVLAVLGAIGLFLLPYIGGHTGEGSALNRLTSGAKDVTGADTARSDALSQGWHLFLHSPIVGNGLSQVGTFHNLFLEVAAGAGVIGLAGYLMMLFAFLRPMFTAQAHHGLAYVAWAYVGLAASVPGLDDRTLLVPMSLAFLLAATPASGQESPDQVSDLDVSSTVPSR